MIIRDEYDTSPFTWHWLKEDSPGASHYCYMDTCDFNFNAICGKVIPYIYEDNYVFLIGRPESTCIDCERMIILRELGQ